MYDFFTKYKYINLILIVSFSLSCEEDGPLTNIPSNENNPPTVSVAIDDVTITTGEALSDINVSSTFADEDDDALTYTVASSDEAVVTVSMNGSTLSLTEVGVGSATITVTANDGNDGTVSNEFTVSINALGNNPPTVSVAIDDVTITTGEALSDIDVSSTFADEDGDALTYTVTSSDEAVATASINGSTLSLTEVGVGNATITVTASDGNGGTISDEFTVSINALGNNPPTVSVAIDDVTITTGEALSDIDVSSTFADEDGDALTYTVASSDEAVATASINGSTLSLSEEGVGTTTITVTANDGNGGTISDEFTVSINAPTNNAPTVSVAINDVTITTGDALDPVVLSSIFADADGDVLTFTVASSNEAVVTASIENVIVVLLTEVGVGSAVITVTADDGNGGTVNDEFTVSISALPNNPPTVSSEIANVTITTGDALNDINVSNTFADADGDALTYTVASSDEAVVTASINGSTLSLTEVAEGNATITVTANDGNGGTVSDEFKVTINAPELVYLNAIVSINTNLTLVWTGSYTTADQLAILNQIQAFNDVANHQNNLINGAYTLHPKEAKDKYIHYALDGVYRGGFYAYGNRLDDFQYRIDFSKVRWFLNGREVATKVLDDFHQDEDGVITVRPGDNVEYDAVRLIFWDNDQNGRFGAIFGYPVSE